MSISGDASAPVSGREVFERLLTKNNLSVSLSGMELKIFLLSMPVPDREKFAERCGTSYAHLRNIAYGLKPCSPGLAVSVARESDSRIPYESLNTDVDWNYVRESTATEPTPQEL